MIRGFIIILSLLVFGFYFFVLSNCNEESINEYNRRFKKDNNMDNNYNPEQEYGYYPQQDTHMDYNQQPRYEDNRPSPTPPEDEGSIFAGFGHIPEEIASFNSTNEPIYPESQFYEDIGGNKAGFKNENNNSENFSNHIEDDIINTRQNYANNVNNKPTYGNTDDNFAGFGGVLDEGFENSFEKPEKDSISSSLFANRFGNDDDFVGKT